MSEFVDFRRDEAGITFTEGDLSTSIAGTKITRIDGRLGESGMRNLNVRIHDVYDFDFKNYEGDPVIAFGNNLATISSGTGAIKTYNVTVRFQDTYEQTNEDEEE